MQGERGSKLYFIVSGTVGSYKRQITEDKDWKLIDVYSLGALFGSDSVIGNSPRTETIRCHTDCIFATLKRSDFNKNLAMLRLKQFSSY